MLPQHPSTRKLSVLLARTSEWRCGVLCKSEAPAGRGQGLRRPYALPASRAGSPPLPQPGPPPPAPAVSPDSHEDGSRPDVPVNLRLSPGTGPLSASCLLRPGSARPASAATRFPLPRPLAVSVRWERGRRARSRLFGWCCPLAAAGRTRWALSRARPLGVAARTDAPPSRRVGSSQGPGKGPQEAGPTLCVLNAVSVSGAASAGDTPNVDEHPQ